MFVRGLLETETMCNVFRSKVPDLDSNSTTSEGIGIVGGCWKNIMVSWSFLSKKESHCRGRSLPISAVFTGSRGLNCPPPRTLRGGKA